MKIFKYIFVLAVAAMATACGDNDPSVVVKDYSVSAKVINVTYGSATVEINAPRPEGYAGGDYWQPPFYTTLKNVATGTEVYSSYDNRTDEVVGDRLVTTITYKGLEPGCEYQLLYEGGTLEAFNQYGSYDYDESSELPPIEVLTFKTPTISSAGLLGANVTKSYTEDNGAILILDFPYSVRISNYSYLYATKEDMSDAKEIKFNSHYYISELGNGSPQVGVALGGFLKPNTTYYFQIKGDYMVYMGDGDEEVSFTNTVCTPVKFRTSDKHTGLLGDAAVNTVYGDPSATMTDYSSSGLTVNFDYTYLVLFDTPAYTTVVTEFVKGKTYYPLCTFDCYVTTSQNYKDYHVRGVSMPTPNAITY